MDNSLKARALQTIAKSTSPEQLQRMADNARAKGEQEVYRAALLRLYAVLPSAKQGTLEYDVWQSVHALEGELTAERNKTTRLSRTRQKIKRDGEARAVADLVTGRVADGFTMLVDRKLPQLTFEAVALKHPGRFSQEVLASAERRLRDHGYDPRRLTSENPDPTAEPDA